MDEDSLAGKSDAELKAEMQRIQREFEARQRLKKEQQLEARRRNVGEDSTPSGQTLAPASPSPRKKIKNALMKPVQTNASKTLLDSHKLALARRTRHERDYALPSFQNVGSSSNSSSSTSRSKREDADLATMLEDDAASRLAQQKRIVPSRLLDSHANARKQIKDANAQRGIAHLRSTNFNEAAPKRAQPVASTSTQPIPSYNTSYKQAINAGNGYSSSSSYARRNDQNMAASSAYKGKSVERPEEAARKQPETHHAWSTRGNADTQNHAIKEEDDYYSFEEEAGVDGEDEAAYQDIQGYDGVGTERNEDLTVVHRLRPGPKHFKRLASDPTFETVEPNSKIFLSKRILAHDQLQEHLSDRFYLPHDTLYSIVRPSKGGLEYEVPVEGDWIIIGVLAEKSEIKYTGGGTGNMNDGAMKQVEMRRKMEEERKERAKEAMKERMKAKFRNDGRPGTDSKPYDDSAFDELAKSDDELREAFEGSDGEMRLDDDRKGKKKQTQEEREPPPRRRYITFKLIDLGKKGGGGGTGVLSMKLFESDPDRRRTIKSSKDSDEEETETIINKKTGKKTLVTRSKKEKKLAARSKNNASENESDEDRFERKEYKGGSGGAFEKFWKELNGTVVAILNPRIMKPWQNPYVQGPNSNVLSITPESADSIIVIGKSRDLGSCQAKRKDGSLCSAWCDIRLERVCDYHIQQAVQKRRAGRAELLSGTGGMQTTSFTGEVTSLQPQKKTSSSRIFSGGSSYSHPYDPVNKVGLLPRNNTSVQEGAKTYVVSSGLQNGGSHAMRNGNRTGGYLKNVIGAPKPDASAAYNSGREDGRRSSNQKQLTPKELAEKKSKEERRLRSLLQKEGGKSVGAKYLQNNGKAPLVGRRSRDDQGGEGDESTSQSEMDTDGAEATEARTRKRRVFGIESLRKIGFDPTAAPALMDPKEHKRKMEAMQILGDPEAYEPKLGRHPGKTHSNVNVTVQSFKSSKRRSDETNDEEDGESSDAPRPAKKRSSMPSKQDSGFEDSSADADLAKVKTVEARPTSHAPVNQANSDDESDLEIEPPVSS